MQRKEFIQQSTLAGIGLFIRPLSSFSFSPEGKDNVVYYGKQEVAYDQLRKGFNERINHFPAIIAVCFTTRGVQQAVLHAKKLKLPVSIKSGGHCMEGLSSNNGGMQIIVSEINRLVWKEDYRISIGPGCKLQHLYEQLLPKGRIIPGGSCAGVAIGGLSLGGGYGLLSRSFGLTCDSLEEVTMVDGEGQIISSKNDSELLWACRGGGNGNFGVITEMVFKTHRSPKTLSHYRFRYYNVDKEKGKNILKTWMDECLHLDNACFSACLFNKDTVYILLTNTSSKQTITNQFVQQFKTQCNKFTRRINQPIASALKNYYGIQHPVRFKNASAGLYKTYADLEPMIDQVLTTVLNTNGMIFQLNTMGGNIQLPENEKRSSFPHRSYHFFTELQTYWDNDTSSERLMKRFADVQKIISDHGVSAQYRNYPDLDFKQYLEKYYGASLSRLRSIKTRFDPNNRIQHEQSIR